MEIQLLHGTLLYLITLIELLLEIITPLELEFPYLLSPIISAFLPFFSDLQIVWKHSKPNIVQCDCSQL